MIIIDELSEVPHSTISYPDGQNDVVINANAVTGDVTIIAEFNSFADLELILAATSALRNLGAGRIHLSVPCMFGQRSDRKFKGGGSDYFVEVISPIINAQRYASVSSFDPHSRTVILSIDNYYPCDLTTFYQRAFDTCDLKRDRLTLVCPDKGAKRRVSDAAAILNCDNEILVCDKARDGNGKIIGTEVPLPNGTENDHVIIDDLCDGGGTFIAIAKILKPKITGRLILWVTHGLFSKGIDDLKEHFDAVRFLTSPKQISDNVVRQIHG